MPLSAQQYQTLIVSEVGDTASGVVAGQIETIWTLYDTEASLFHRYLLAKRKALEILMGTVREQVSQARGQTRTDLTDKLKNLVAMYNLVDGQIANETTAAAETAASSRSPQSGELTNVVPVAPPAGSLVDANAVHLRGDPYSRSWRR